MAKSTKIHQYAVLWLSSQNRPIDYIVNETGLSQKQIENILKKYHNDTTATQDTPPATAKNHKHPNLMIMDSGAKKFRVAIMTKDASMAHDSIMQNVARNNQDKSSYIYRPQNE